MNVEATTTPDITYGEFVTVGEKHVRARLLTILGEDFLQFGDGVRKPCGNCDGGFSGYKSAYAGIFAGECFQCRGTGVGSAAITEEKALKLAKARIAARKRTARKAAEKAAAAEKVGADWRAANSDVAALGEAIYAEMAEAGYEGHMDVDARWGGKATHLANLVGMGRALTPEQTAELPEAVAEAIAAQDAEQARQDSQSYLGTLGDFVTVTGTVKSNISVETRYGFTRLLIVEGTGEFTGVTIKAWGNSKPIREAVRGDAITINGTVKGHEEYDGTKQTELGKAKITAA